MADKIIKEVTKNNLYYAIYESGLVIQRLILPKTNRVDLPIRYADNTYSISARNINKYNPKNYYIGKSSFAKDINSRKKQQIYPNISPSCVVFKFVSVSDTSISAIICPVNKTAKTLGIKMPNSTSYKGPSKTALVENIQTDQNIGTGTGVVSSIDLKLAINQFITLHVDIPGAKINNLPVGFTFANNEITGAAKNPGEYNFNIVSDSVTLPVKFTVSNIIRIS